MRETWRNKRIQAPKFEEDWRQGREQFFKNNKNLVAHTKSYTALQKLISLPTPTLPRTQVKGRACVC